MKGIRLVLLAVLLCSKHALSLLCYNCADSEDFSKCQTNFSCPSTPSICYRSTAILTEASGQTATLQAKGCAPSCKEASEEMRQFAEKSNPLGGVKLEVRDVHCCEKDLCNGVAQVGRSLWALVGGLLLSLGACPPLGPAVGPPGTQTPKGEGRHH